MIAHFLYVGRHGLIFVFAKSTVLLAPLLAAAILNQATYGRVEWWLAISLSLGPIFGMGAAGVVAYGTIGGRLERHLRTATLFTLFVATLLVVLALTIRLFSESWEKAYYGIIALQGSIFCLQTTFSSRLKGLGKGAWASVIESALYISLFGALLVTRLGVEFIGAYASALLIVCALLAVGLKYFTPLPTFPRWFRRNYRDFLRVGSVFMIGSALMGGFMAAPRVLLGFWSSPEEVAEFALAFRWLSMAIVIHQFINTVFFRKIFGDINIRKRERLLTISVAMVAFVVFTVAGFVKIAPLLESSIPIPQNLNLLLPIGIGIILWATTACLEGSLYRLAATAEQTRSVAIGLVVLIIVSGALGIITNSELTNIVAYAWVAGLVAIILSQYLSLRALGQQFSLLLQAVLALSVFGIILLTY